MTKSWAERCNAAWAPALLVCIVLAACQGGAGSEPGSSAADAPVTSERLVVFAASSLRDPFGALAQDFRAAHPGAELTFNFAGSQELRTQVEQGARADVFASADQKHMAALVREHLVSAPITFARNEPVIVVARESAGRILRIDDLPSVQRIVIGTPEVPIGRYTLDVLDRASTLLGADFRARVEARVVSRELNVKQVLAKVQLGEAQAGIVYRSDARAAKSVATVDIPASINVVAEYPIAVLSAAPHAELARAWVELVASRVGQAKLQAAGFLPPAQALATP